MLDKDEESTVLYGTIILERPKDADQVKLYGRRWYCLFLYALFCFCLTFNTSYIGTLEHALMLAFGWKKLEITLLGIWARVMYMTTFWITSWLLDTKGPRAATLFASGFLAAGSAIQCITSNPTYATWTFQLAQIFMAVAIPLVNGGEASFANTWFPPHQRTLATAGPYVGIYIGISLSSVLGPIVVPVRPNYEQNVSFLVNSTSNTSTYYQADPSQSILREEIMRYVYIQFGMAITVFLALLIYFPSKPPTPPSISASASRMSLKCGVETMIKKPMFWILLAAFSLSGTINAVYGSLLDLILIKAKIPGDEAMTGYMLLGSTIAGLILSFFVASFVDRFKNLAKHVLVVCVAVACVLTLWFAILLQGLFVPSTGQLYVSFILGQGLLLSILPVFYELACDVTYPVGEGLTGGALNFGNNLVGCIFLLIQMIPDISPRTINWICFGALGLCVPLLLAFKPEKART